MGDFLSQVAAALGAQSKFLHAGLYIIAGVVLRERGFIRVEDSLPLSKLTFNLFFPALLFAKISKAELSLDLWRVAVTSVTANVLLVAVVLAAAQLVPQRGGRRGQWAICVMGGNIGFTYPLVLAAGSIADKIFPRLVVWDVAGNAPVVFAVNYIVAMYLSPQHQLDNKREASAPKDRAPTMDPDTPGQNLEALDGSSASQMESGLAPVKEHGDSSERPDTHEEEPSGARETAVSGTGTMVLVSAISVGGGLSMAELTKASATSGPSVFTILRRVCTNLPFLAEIFGLAINLSGLRLPKVADDLLEATGEPYSALLFIILGLNLRWKTIRSNIVLVSKFISVRMLLGAGLAALVWVLPALQDAPSKQAALIGFCCPVGGIMMSYVLDFGYDASLQAAVMTTSNIISFFLLFILLTLI